MGSKSSVTNKGPKVATLRNSIGGVVNYGPVNPQRRFTQAGVNTPNYWAKVGRVKNTSALLPENSVRITYVSQFEGLPMFYEYGSGIKYTVSGDSLAFFGANNGNLSRTTAPSGLGCQAEWDNHSQVISNKLRSKIQDMKVNLAQALGERKQTAKLLEDAVVKVVNSVINLRRGKLHVFCDIWGIPVRNRHKKWSPGKVSKKWANLWLEYQYGWKPFMSDIYGSAEVLAQQAVLREGILRTRARATHRSVGGYVDSMAIAYPPKPTFSRKNIYNMELKSNGYASFVITKQLPNLGVGNPLLLAWELLPFSFVADWFLGVGNYLQGIDALDGVTIFRSGISRKLEVKVIDVLPFGEDRSASFTEFQRGTLSLDGQFYINENRFDFAKFVTSVALVRQVFDKSTKVQDFTWNKFVRPFLRT